MWIPPRCISEMDRDGGQTQWVPDSSVSGDKIHSTTFRWSKHITGLRPTSRDQEENPAFLMATHEGHSAWCQPLLGPCSGQGEEEGLREMIMLVSQDGSFSPRPR